MANLPKTIKIHELPEISEINDADIFIIEDSSKTYKITGKSLIENIKNNTDISSYFVHQTSVNNKNGIAPLDGISRTISARYYKDGSEILIAQEGKNPRRLTPRECARLQGFPDSFKIPVSDTQAYKQFGNSVVVPLMAEVAKLVVSKLEEMDVVTVTSKVEGMVD